MTRHHDLMRLHDGEFTDDELAELAVIDPEDERVLEGLEQIGQVLRAQHNERAKAAPDVTDWVMAHLDDPPARNAEKPKVEPLDRVRKAAPQKTKVASVVAIGLALAAAAAWALWPKPGIDTTTRPAPVAQTAVPLTTEEPAPEPVAVVEEDDGPPAASIEAVDFGNHPGTIFMVPAGDESTPVVWLEDEAPPARMERL